MIKLFQWEQEETKRCGICHRDLPIALFGKEGKGKNGYLRYECRECANTNSKTVSAIRKTAPPVPEGYRCPICDRDETQLPTYGKNKKSVWVLDHCHVNKTFRGWLCQKCNMGLGNFGDNIDRLKKAMDYLKDIK